MTAETYDEPDYWRGVRDGAAWTQCACHTQHQKWCGSYPESWRGRFKRTFRRLMGGES